MILKKRGSSITLYPAGVFHKQKGEKPRMDRRLFLLTAGLTTGALPTMGQTTPAKKTIPDKGPAIADELVKDFVGAAHGDLAKVEAMLKEQPKLVNAVWDWGGGDFESALGGAAHMGRADIANALLKHGARLDLYAAAMLGELEIVRTTLTAFPDAKNILGPHGIPLLAHAKAGGDKAAEVVEYLESLK